VYLQGLLCVLTGSFLCFARSLLCINRVSFVYHKGSFVYQQGLFCLLTGLLLCFTRCLLCVNRVFGVSLSAGPASGKPVLRRIKYLYVNKSLLYGNGTLLCLTKSLF